MGNPTQSTKVARFEAFELNLDTGELRKSGTKIRLQEQSFKILAALLEHPGKVVSRDELHDRLWPDNTFVDFDKSLNIAVSKLRQALGDSADEPRLVETLPRRGYRFIGAVEPVEESGASIAAPVNPPPARQKSRSRRLAAAGFVAVLAAVGAIWKMATDGTSATAPVMEEVWRVTDDVGLSMHPALSPDGNLVAYVSDRDGGGDLELWVRHVAGGAPFQVTHNQVHETRPRFSPDGSRIVYLSGGDVYTTAALGNESPRFIAGNGNRPSYSPDGRKILFNRFGAGVSLHVVDAEDGSPIFEVTSCCNAYWLPDSEHVLHARLNPNRTFDAWIVPIDGREPIRTDIWDRVREARLISPRRLPAGIEVYGLSPTGDSFVFSARRGDAENIWRVPIDRHTFQSAGPAEPVTRGGAVQGIHSLARNGLLAYEEVEWNIDIWTLPVHANAGELEGDLQRVTRRAERDILPTLSRDGKILAHLSDGEGAEPDVLTVNLVNGQARNVTSSRAHEFYSVVSRDGSKMAYIRRLQPDEDDIYSVYQADVSGDVTIPIVLKLRFDQRLRLGDWTPDLAGLVTEGGRLDVATGEITEIFGQGFRAFLPKLSPDGKWVVFSPHRRGESRGAHQLVIAPFRTTGPPISDEEWIFIATPPGENSNADWSPDGNRLYFLSNRDGHRCLWTQRLEPVHKTPVGEAQEVHHFPRADLSLATEYFTYVLGPSVAEDKIALGLIESRGNVWMVQTDLGR